MVSNSAKLYRRTKQHTQFGVSASNGSRDMGRTKSWRKKKKKRKKKKQEKKRKMNIDKTKEKKEKKDKRKIKKNEHRQNYIASPTGSLTRQVLGRPVCDRGAFPRTLVQ